MALTLQVEKRLARSGLIAFFDENRDTWVSLAQKTYDFVKDTYPANSVIRRDDVAKELRYVIDVNDDLINKLAEKKLTQVYYYAYFTDLIVDRSWDEISTPEQP
jgi:hypothetical protein